MSTAKEHGDLTVALCVVIIKVVGSKQLTSVKFKTYNLCLTCTLPKALVVLHQLYTQPGISLLHSLSSWSHGSALAPLFLISAFCERTGSWSPPSFAFCVRRQKKCCFRLWLQGQHCRKIITVFGGERFNLYHVCKNKWWSIFTSLIDP